MQLRTFTPSGAWTALPAMEGKKADLLNNSGAKLEIRYAHDTTAGHHLSLANGQSVSLPVAMLVSEIQAQGAGSGDVSILVS